MKRTSQFTLNALLGLVVLVPLCGAQQVTDSERRFKMKIGQYPIHTQDRLKRENQETERERVARLKAACAERQTTSQIGPTQDSPDSRCCSSNCTSVD